MQENHYLDSHMNYREIIYHVVSTCGKISIKIFYMKYREYIAHQNIYIRVFICEREKIPYIMSESAFRFSYVK